MHKYKILIIGESGVGKTSFLGRHSGDRFNIRHLVSQLANMKELTLHTNKGDIDIDVWDVAGDERYSGHKELYMKNVDGVILMFDLTRKSSFDNLRYLHKKTIENVGAHVPIVIVGNKSDSVAREVSPRKAELIERMFKAPYFEVSSLNEINIAEPFTELARLMTGDRTLRAVY